MKNCPKCGASYEPSHRFCAADGEVLEESPEALVGQTLDGQYHVEAFVARGGMGTIYRARHVLLGDRVAIKLLRPEMRTDSAWLRRFRREGQAARRFRHPNSVTVHDLRTCPDGTVYMVMEYVEGHTLDAELRRRGRFTPREALAVIEPVARVLDEAHSEGVVHRDLKPGNVMLARDDDGRVEIKLLDLGIAKLLDPSGAGGDEGMGPGPALTVAGQILGTPYYMSPEQWGETPRDGLAEIDGRADVYRLGVICYELVAGRRPFLGKTVTQLRHAHATAPPPSLAEVCGDAPADFALAVGRAMAKDRGDRFATAGAFADALRAALGLEESDEESDDLAFLAAEQTPPHELSLAADASSAGGPTAPRADTPAGPTAIMDRDATRVPASALVAPDRATQPPHRAGDRDGRNGRPADADLTIDSRSAPGERPTEVQRTSQQWSTRLNGSAPQAHASGGTGYASAPVVPQAQGFAPSRGVSNTHGYPAADAPHVSRATRPARRGGVVVAVIAAVLLLAVCVAGLAGWLVWRVVRSERAAREATTPSATRTPARVEALSYWIETFEDAKAERGQRVARAGEISLASGRQFKFHFSPRQRGYFYVVGPGEANAPTTFLTAKPAGPGLLKTNLAAANSDFVFPYGPGQVLELDRNPGTDEFTVIFSATPLLSPPFLAARAGRRLSPAELKELDELRARAASDASSLDVKDSGGGQSVALSVPASAGQPQLVVFDVRIEHR
jgi:serine/threonine-protein kinase